MSKLLFTVLQQGLQWPVTLVWSFLPLWAKRRDPPSALEEAMLCWSHHLRCPLWARSTTRVMVYATNLSYSFRVTWGGFFLLHIWRNSLVEVTLSHCPASLILSEAMKESLQIHKHTQPYAWLRFLQWMLSITSLPVLIHDRHPNHEHLLVFKNEFQMCLGS